MKLLLIKDKLKQDRRYLLKTQASGKYICIYSHSGKIGQTGMIQYISGYDFIWLGKIIYD